MGVLRVPDLIERGNRLIIGATANAVGYGGDRDVGLLEAARAACCQSNGTDFG